MVMHLVENWQSPSSDDINPDALEYLFNQKQSSRKTPWVEMASEPEPVVRITPEYIRLQTRVEILKGTIELTSSQLQEAHFKIGMLSAELARRDDQLRELSEYRVRAAMAVAYARHNELLQSALDQTKRELTESLAKHTDLAAGGALAAFASTPDLDRVTADNYRIAKSKNFSFPFLLLNSLLMIGFATAVLITILR